MKRKTKVKLARLQRNSIIVGKKVAGIILGSILSVISYEAFILPYKLLSGGVSGLALIAHYTLSFPFYLGIFALNLPVFVWGLKMLDRKLIVYSAVGAGMIIVMLPLLGPYIPKPNIDIFLASIASGVVGGLGSGITFRQGASMGGTDIISLIMKKKKNISIGTTSFYCNIFIIALSLFFFDMKIAMYTAISMWVGSKVTDSVVNGFNKNKYVTIISERNAEIADRIMNEMHRGVTYLEGQGAFSGNSKMVINCVVNHFEIAKIKEIVGEIDKKAFVFVTETVEVMGRGFTF
ncbi:MAG TPA: YitT family protein [Spirochaetia bacterium]|nr:YitT family protein [Spirochaetia bacterium]